MAATISRAPPALAPKPERSVHVLRLHRQSYFGIHYPVDESQNVGDGITEASVLAFSRKFDAQRVAGWLAIHRQITNLWPSRLLDVERGLELNAGQLQPFAEPEVPLAHLQGLTIEEEPFSLFLRTLSLEGVALRLITELQSDGRMNSTVFKEKIEQQMFQQHFQMLMTKKSAKT